jgi:hypothetical protein
MSDAKRLWWPTDWADEVMPCGRPTPDEFIIDAEGFYYLGYALDAKDVGEHDKRYFNSELKPGAIVQFICSDDLGGVTVEIHRDGRYTVVEGEVVAHATHFWSAGDSDTLADSMAEFARMVAENDSGLDIPWPQTVPVRMAWWSDSVPHEFKVFDAKLLTHARFERVTAQ